MKTQETLEIIQKAEKMLKVQQKDLNKMSAEIRYLRQKCSQLEIERKQMENREFFRNIAAGVVDDPLARKQLKKRIDGFIQHIERSIDQLAST